MLELDKDKSDLEIGVFHLLDQAHNLDEKDADSEEAKEEEEESEEEDEKPSSLKKWKAPQKSPQPTHDEASNDEVEDKPDEEEDKPESKAEEEGEDESEEDDLEPTNKKGAKKRVTFAGLSPMLESEKKKMRSTRSSSIVVGSNYATFTKVPITHFLSRFQLCRNNVKHPLVLHVPDEHCFFVVDVKLEPQNLDAEKVKAAPSKRVSKAMKKKVA